MPLLIWICQFFLFYPSKNKVLGMLRDGGYPHVHLAHLSPRAFIRVSTVTNQVLIPVAS
jgi:hypothetical protein